MGRRSGEASIAIGSGSSIAILQERFKQLERNREKREEKELLEWFCSPARETNASPTGLTLFQPHRMQQQNCQLKPATEVYDPLSLELCCWKNLKHDAGELKNMSLASPEWSAVGLNEFCGSHESLEVDTTLHL